MATSTQIRNAIRAAARMQGIEKFGNTYTDRKPSGTYVGFPMPFGEGGKAAKIAEEANFLLFATTGERDVVRVVRTPREFGQYHSGRAYLRATVA
jgi:hypothetical protein